MRWSVAAPLVCRCCAAHGSDASPAWSAALGRASAPAIALAEQGFAVSPRLHTLIGLEKYLTQPRGRAYFYDANGKALIVGTVLRNPAYAATLRTLARDGADAFYTGAIARDIVATVNGHPRNPGDMTLEDLAGYRVDNASLCAGLTAPIACAAFRCRRRVGSPFCRCSACSALRCGVDGASKLLERAFHQRSGTPGLCGPRGLTKRIPRSTRRPRGLLDPGLPAALFAVDPADCQHRPRAAGSATQAGATSARAAFGTDNSLELPSTSHMSIVDRDGNVAAMTARSRRRSAANERRASSSITSSPISR